MPKSFHKAPTPSERRDVGHSYTSLFCDQMRAIGFKKQHILRKLSVGVIGCGGVGTSAIQILVQNGVGQIVPVDHQVVEPENFNRSPFVTESEFGMPKAQALASWLNRRPHVHVIPIVAPVESATARRALQDVDLICCCSNTTSSRLAAARLAIRKSVPYVSGGVGDARDALVGQVLQHLPTRAWPLACEGCFSIQRLTRQRSGPGVVLPVIAAAIGAVVAHTIVKVALGSADAGYNLCVVNLNAPSLEALAVYKRPDCRICGR